MGLMDDFTKQLAEEAMAYAPEPQEPTLQEVQETEPEGWGIALTVEEAHTYLVPQDWQADDYIPFIEAEDRARVEEMGIPITQV